MRELDNDNQVPVGIPVDFVGGRHYRKEEEANIVQTHAETGIAVGGNPDKGKDKDTTSVAETSNRGRNAGVVSALSQPAVNSDALAKSTSVGISGARDQGQNAHFPEKLLREARLRQNEVGCWPLFVLRMLTTQDRFVTIS